MSPLPLSTKVHLACRSIAVYGSLLLLACFSQPISAQPEHGAAITIQCGVQVRVCDSDAECSDEDLCTTETCDFAIRDTTRCQIRIDNFDDFDDSLQVTEAFGVISTASGPVRIPEFGNLEIGWVDGNTDCTPGLTLPCNIGSDIAGAGPGRVIFIAEGYDPTFSDFGAGDTLLVQGIVGYTDICDGIIDPGCSTSASLLQANAQSFLVAGCSSGEVVSCDDGSACTDDVCDPGTGSCFNTPNVDCDDGDACTTDQCNPLTGDCEITGAVECDDGNACTADNCDTNTGFCDYIPNVNCDDGDTCTDDACDSDTGLCGVFVNGTCNATPEGEDVQVEPIVVDESNNPVSGAPDVDITFEDVDSAGTTTVVVTAYEEGGTPPPPTGFTIGGLSGGPVIYDIDSTATLAPGSVFEICFDYSSLSIAGDPADLALIHEVGGVWVDITSSNDTVNMVLCGISDSFSFYAIVESFFVVGPMDPVPVGTEVSVGIDTGDSPVADTVHWHWGDGTQTDTAVASSEVLASHLYGAPGVYVVTAQLLLTSKSESVETGSAEFRFVVVYDPSAGFVTGGGWIDSPEGAFMADPTQTGTARFGFVSRYKKGAQAPSGTTEFQFKAGELDFHSLSYDWLVIAGSRGQFKGAGTVNGEGNFGFMLTVVDAELTPSTEADLFRIKIWDKENSNLVIYDNGLGASDEDDPLTVIQGGSVTIHKDKK